MSVLSRFFHLARWPWLLPAIMVAAAVVALGHGALERRAAELAKLDPSPTPSPTPVAAVRTDLEKTPLSYFADYWRQLAEHSRQHLVGLDVAGAVAVVVDEQHAVCSLREADRMRLAGLEPPAARLVGIDRASQLAVLELTTAVTFPPPVRAAVEPAAGSWLAGVTMTAEGKLRVVPGHLVGLPEGSGALLDLAAPWPADWDIGAVVDLDARLRGVTVASGGRVRTLPLSRVREIVARALDARRCSALDVGPLSDEVKGALRLGSGVLIERVERGAFEGSEAPLAGDILLSWNGHAIRSPEDFSKQLAAQAPASSLTLRVRRDGRPRTLRPRMPERDCRPPRPEPWASVPFGLSVVESGSVAEDGLRIVFVTPEGVAARAGLQPGDVILRVSDRPARQEAAQRLLAKGPGGARPLLLLVERGERVRLVTLRAASGGAKR